jgi:hypothetical protein
MLVRFWFVLILLLSRCTLVCSHALVWCWLVRFLLWRLVRFLVRCLVRWLVRFLPSSFFSVGWLTLTSPLSSSSEYCTPGLISAVTLRTIRRLKPYLASRSVLPSARSHRIPYHSLSETYLVMVRSTLCYVARDVNVTPPVPPPRAKNVPLKRDRNRTTRALLCV